jgi:sugar phosphate isomerase/epimerase
MNMKLFSPQVICAYLYPITLYGYPPDIRDTVKHIKEMYELGFSSIELEGIGAFNIEYLYHHHEAIGEALAKYNCHLPVLCLVLPQLGVADQRRHAEALEWFEMGCELAHKLGATSVLDNGPLLPLEYPADAPILRHYSEDLINSFGLPTGFVWERHHEALVDTFRKACHIAAKHQLLYHLHPCEGSLITGTDSFQNFSDAINCTNLFFNLDTANQFYFRDNLALSVLRLAEKISYIHISDNRGDRVEHLAPGKGSIHWDSFFEALRTVGFKGSFGIDVGGAESGITDMADAYRCSAEWLQENIKKYSLNQ